MIKKFLRNLSLTFLSVVVLLSLTSVLVAHKNKFRSIIVYGDSGLIIRAASKIVNNGASTLTGLLTVGGNIVSDTDGTDDIGTTSVRFDQGYYDELFANKGADVASLTTAFTLGADGNYYDITGTNAIDSVAAQTVGKVVALQFDDILTITDGGNLKLHGNFVSAAGATLVLQSDGTDWYELSRAGGNYIVQGAFTADATVGVTGVLTATGGITYPTATAFIWSVGGASVLATSGTDQAPTSGPRQWVQINIPYNVTLTGIGYMVGSVGGTDRVVVELYNSAGTVVARSIATDTEIADIVGASANFNNIDFSSTYAAVAGIYYISIQMNGTTARARTYGVAGSKFVAATAAGTFKTGASITPGTTFTADEGPISYVY